jgi:ATP-binding cassette, sub-family E, member 1
MTRIAVVQKEKCNPTKCQDLCIKLCPINREEKDCIIKGKNGKVEVDEKLCTGCGICSNRCPFEAIHIINLPEELDKEPIHRYGKNGFSLYNLPIPIFGKVTGIVGVNGIGKSTAINILAGLLKPNLGKDKDAEYKEIIDYFKGTEAQGFFEKVKQGEIKVAYKPQQVDLIPKQSKGTVKELLEMVDEKKKLKEISKDLEIEKILDHDISKISGGELQRVAIAATVLKKANVYFFDEPTSYLDIKQRIKVSKFIRKLADENTAVLVIEHDLIILDYMTDLVHIMYGKQGCYGIVSQPKVTRVGINVYLEGYLKEENVRFRSYKIEFSKRPPIQTKKDMLLTSWDSFEQKVGSFKLEAENGEIYKNQVLGILGENGIGKTTFVKILAGEIKTPYSLKDLEVSYKPQYLEKSDELVAMVLKDAIKKYNTQLIRPLNIKPLLEKPLNKLSGGELQRVAIAECLSRDADIYLLDEPSAYLDVEQRLVVSKTIRDFIETNNKSALIVDHDLLFIDYISEGLIVFSGIPAVSGKVNPPSSMEQGMNIFLDDLKITFRRDTDSNRPRANKPGSQMDEKQKKENKLYYS